MPGTGTERASRTPLDLPRRRPVSALAPYVTGLTGYDMTGVEVVHHGVPSPELTFILALGRPLSVGWSTDRSRSRDFHGMVSGLHDAPAFIFPTAGHAGVQLGLTPLGARALLGLPAGAVAAGLIGLEELWGPVVDDLLGRLEDGDGWADRFDRVEAALLARLAPESTIRPELAWAWQRIVHGGVTATGGLADEIGWSRGYFARLFAAEFGLKPKETARVARFTRARSAAAQPGTGLAAVAAAHGYADQAHLTREWRRLAGCTPTDWRTEMSAFVQDGSPTGGAEWAS